MTGPTPIRATFNNMRRSARSPLVGVVDPAHPRTAASGDLLPLAAYRPIERTDRP